MGVGCLLDAMRFKTGRANLDWGKTSQIALNCETSPPPGRQDSALGRCKSLELVKPGQLISIFDLAELQMNKAIIWGWLTFTALVLGSHLMADNATNAFDAPGNLPALLPEEKPTDADVSSAPPPPVPRIPPRRLPAHPPPRAETPKPAESGVHSSPTPYLSPEEEAAKFVLQDGYASNLSSAIRSSRNRS